MKLRRQGFSGVALLSLVLLLATGCEIIDNQSNILKVAPHRYAEVNPIPYVPGRVANYEAQNKNHKVLVAIFDSGVDYNHPNLAANMHFDLYNGQPIGLGYDFIGQEKWPSPYLARTLERDFEAAIGTRKRALTAITNNYKMRVYMPKELAKFVSPDREITQEIESKAFHGTHVAGIIANGMPEIGLVPYRILPFNKIYKDGKGIETETFKLFTDNLIAAIKLASEKGVRIVNMSVESDEDRPYDKTEKEDAYAYKEQEELYARVTKVILDHPHILFLAATGNDGKWLDGSTRLSFPCGIKASNILCVGALDTENRVAAFSNVLITDSPIVYAPGSSIVSTYPTLMCPPEEDIKNVFHDLYTDAPAKPVAAATATPAPAKGDKKAEAKGDGTWNDRAKVEESAKKVTKSCKNEGFVKLTGTSMATPLVARYAAQILLQHLNWTPAQVIEEILKSSQDQALGQLLTVKVLPLEVPKWEKEKAAWAKKMPRLWK